MMGHKIFLFSLPSGNIIDAKSIVDFEIPYFNNLSYTYSVRVKKPLSESEYTILKKDRDKKSNIVFLTQKYDRYLTAYATSVNDSFTDLIDKEFNKEDARNKFYKKMVEKPENAMSLMRLANSMGFMKIVNKDTGRGKMWANVFPLKL